MTGACLSSHSRSQQTWDPRSNKMIGIRTELVLGTEGRAGGGVSTGRDKVRHVSSEGAFRQPPVMLSGHQLPIHLLAEVFILPINPCNPARPVSSSPT